MSRKYTVIGILLVAILVITGIWLWNWVLGDTEAASGPITAVPVVTEAPTTAAVITEAPNEPDSVITETPNEPVVEETPVVTVLPESGPIVFQISQDDSEASFTIYEDLRGQPKDVIGTTDQVAGEIALDKSDLSAAQVGVIQVNARTLVTDDDRRNQAIRNRILNTDNYEFITFTPTEISGLEGTAAVGQEFTFQITGDLTIRDVTKPVVFDVTAQLVSEDQLTAHAETKIQRSDFNLVIPSVPFVANVGEEIALEINLVANLSP
ncbi:MAG: YceI family protein [Chloroflexi bacterium]|nr:YceI family protein [Chloroflexota bacterium]